MRTAILTIKSRQAHLWHRNKLVLRIGDVRRLVWLSFALANTGPSQHV